MEIDIKDYEELTKMIARSFRKYRMHSGHELESMAYSSLFVLSKNLDCDPRKIKQFLNAGIHNHMVDQHKRYFRSRKHIRGFDAISKLDKIIEIKEIINCSVVSETQKEVVDLKIQGFKINEIIDETGLQKTTIKKLWDEFVTRFNELWRQ